MASFEMPRVLVYNRLDQYKYDLDPTLVTGLETVEEVNGEHSLTITTTQALARSDRILMKDAMGIWHEWVVLGDEATHNNSGVAPHEYYCVWSVQYDLTGTYIDTQVGLVPGHASIPSAVRLGLEAALSGTTRWAIGTIGINTLASGSFYRRSGWDGLKTVIEKWGGELDVTISTGQLGVTARAVNLLDFVGSSTVRRRFDWGHDVTSIRRTAPEQPVYCRIVPLSKSEQTENGGYTRRKTIADVNGGIVWLEDANMVDYAKVADGHGGWEYPTLIVENDTYEEPQDLLDWALEHITDYTQPSASYEAGVAQFAQAGMNVYGVALGDSVQVVDTAFSEEGLRLLARVYKIKSNLLDPKDVTLTIGTASATLAGMLESIAGQVKAITEMSLSTGDIQAASAYIRGLLAQLNAEANSTGGYTYITEGQGIRCYDRPVSDPLDGTGEATQVVEIKGGNIRIANSLTSGGEWDFKTVLVSGHIAAELVTAARIVSGYIGSVGGTYIDLDSNIVHLGDDDSSHLILDERSLRLVDGDGETYLYVSDLRDNYNKTVVNEYLVADGTSRAFTVAMTPTNYAQESVTVTAPGGTQTTANYTRSGKTYTLSTTPAAGSIVHICYQTEETFAKAFTYGSRKASGNVGVLSAVLGYNCEAAGYAATAMGEGTFAPDRDMLALGRWNAKTYSGPLVIGNGTSESNRSNALALAWDGTLELGKPLPRASGGTGVTELGSSSVTYNGTISNLTSVTNSVTTNGIDVTLHLRFKGNLNRPDTFVQVATLPSGYAVPSGKSVLAPLWVVSGTNSNTLAGFVSIEGSAIKLRSISAMTASNSEYDVCTTFVR